MSATSKLYFETIGVEEEFYVLKFPLKLWRIVNECRSGAIRWGPFGKTILIDYNQFQAEYLECPVPKFKTRNMTSFVRQLNMYGFKKLQTQQRNVMSRFCNIHEFYNESFRGNRPDLLSKVKRRTIPLKMERLSHSMRPSKKLPPSEMCKKFFDEALMNSPQLFGFWKVSSPVLPNGVNIIKPRYQITVIPACKTEMDEASETVVADIPLLPNYERLVITDSKEDLQEPQESEDEDATQDGIDPTRYEMSITSFAPDTVVPPKFETENMDKLEVKEGFDGSHYIMEVTGQLEQEKIEIKEDSIGGQQPMESAEETAVLNPSTSDIPQEDVLLHIPETSDDEFYISIAKAFTNM